MRRILFAVAVTLVTGSAFSQSPPITLQADTLLDGRGKVLKNVSITVQDGRGRRSRLASPRCRALVRQATRTCATPSHAVACQARAS